MFKRLLILCSLIFWSTARINWCSNPKAIYPEVKKCLLTQPNCKLRVHVIGEYMTQEQFIEAKFGCRYNCSIRADCTRKPWDRMDSKLDLAVWFAKCMKKCNNPYMKHARYTCSENCWAEFKLMERLESSESSEENHS